jgi:ribonuclease VapC
VIVVDSSALVAILRREPEADRFMRIMAEAAGCLLSSVNLLETSMVLAGRTGDATAWADLDELIARAGIEIVPQDAAQASTAREAFLRYGKSRHAAGLNFGDCAAFALAKQQDLPLLFKGDDFCRTELRTAAVQ